MPVFNSMSLSDRIHTHFTIILCFIVVIVFFIPIFWELFFANPNLMPRLVDSMGTKVDSKKYLHLFVSAWEPSRFGRPSAQPLIAPLLFLVQEYFIQDIILLHRIVNFSPLLFASIGMFLFLHDTELIRNPLLCAVVSIIYGINWMTLQEISTILKLVYAFTPFAMTFFYRIFSRKKGLWYNCLGLALSLTLASLTNIQAPFLVAIASFPFFAALLACPAMRRRSLVHVFLGLGLSLVLYFLMMLPVSVIYVRNILFPNLGGLSLFISHLYYIHIPNASAYMQFYPQISSSFLLLSSPTITNFIELMGLTTLILILLPLCSNGKFKKVYAYSTLIFILIISEFINAIIARNEIVPILYSNFFLLKSLVEPGKWWYVITPNLCLLLGLGLDEALRCVSNKRTRARITVRGKIRNLNIHVKRILAIILVLVVLLSVLLSHNFLLLNIESVVSPKKSISSQGGWHEIPSYFPEYFWEVGQKIGEVRREDGPFRVLWLPQEGFVGATLEPADSYTLFAAQNPYLDQYLMDLVGRMRATASPIVVSQRWEDLLVSTDNYESSMVIDLDMYFSDETMLNIVHVGEYVYPYVHTGYMFRVNALSDYFDAQILRIDPEAWTYIGTGTENRTMTSLADKKVHVRILIQDTHFEIHLNGTRMVFADDDTYKLSGPLALISERGSSYVEKIAVNGFPLDFRDLPSRVGNLGTLLAPLNVRYAVVFKNINQTMDIGIWYGGEGKFPQYIIGKPETFVRVLGKQEDLELISETSNYVIYENKVFIPMVAAYSPLPNSLNDTSNAFPFVIKETEAIVKVLSMNPYYSPSEYVIEADVTQPVALVLGQRYNPFWQAYIVDSKGTKHKLQHFEALGWANGFLLNQEGKFKVVITFEETRFRISVIWIWVTFLFALIITFPLLFLFRRMKSSKIIAFSGMDSSGKTTAAILLTKRLDNYGLKANFHPEFNFIFLKHLSFLCPHFVNLIRSNSSRGFTNYMLLNKQKNYKSVLLNIYFLLFWLDHLLAHTIFRLRGGITVLDKGIHNFLTHLKFRGYEDGLIWKLFNFFPRPDIAIFLDVSPEVAFSRSKKNDLHYSKIQFKIIKSFRHNFKCDMILKNEGNIRETVNKILPLMVNDFPSS